MSAVGEYAGGYGFSLPNPVSMHREYPRSRLWIEWCMQLFKKQRYLARDFKVLRCRIRYNPESIRGVVVQTTSRAIPTAIRTCSTRTGTMMVKEGVKNVLSSGRDIEGGVESYNTYPEYKENIPKYGIYAIEIKPTS